MSSQEVVARIQKPFYCKENEPLEEHIEVAKTKLGRLTSVSEEKRGTVQYAMN